MQNVNSLGLQSRVAARLNGAYNLVASIDVDEKKEEANNLSFNGLVAAENERLRKNTV